MARLAALARRRPALTPTPPVGAPERADLGPAGDYARLLPVERGWDALVATDETLAALRALCSAVPGGGVVALVHGPAGAGKTLAAEVVATQLRLDLVAVDARGLARSHGEGSGRLLGPVFRAAGRPNAVVVLEGADELGPQAAADVVGLAVGRRPPTLLETREPARVDPALAAAAELVVELPAPDEAARRVLWERTVWEVEPTAKVPTDRLAVEPLVGGEIRERVLRGAARARGERRALAPGDLVA